MISVLKYLIIRVTNMIENFNEIVYGCVVVRGLHLAYIILYTYNLIDTSNNNEMVSKMNSSYLFYFSEKKLAI